MSTLPPLASAAGHVAAAEPAEVDYARDRDAALKLIDWFRIDRVRAARVAVIGAGAIGNEVLKNLALLGIGHIFIFDRDTIEMANLSRSVLYRASDNGQPKAIVAARAVRDLNPNVNVYWSNDDITRSLGEGFVRTVDVVIGCLDSLEARYYLNQVCWRAGRPWIDAGIDTLTGQVRAFVPPDGPCFECLFSKSVYAQISCNEIARTAVKRGHVPTTPTMASIVAGVQVQECLKLLSPEEWDDRTLAGKQFYFNGTLPDVDIMSLIPRDDCMVHDDAIPGETCHIEDGSASWPARHLLARAIQELGPDAHLYLNLEVAIERKCPACGDALALARPSRRLYREDLTCQRCGREFRWDSDISQSHVINSRSSRILLDAPLIDLGVPRWACVQARAEGRSMYFELAGDAAQVVTAVSADELRPSEESPVTRREEQ